MERVLFITSTRIGDAVLSSGLLDHLIRTRPEARFTIACGPLAAPLFRSTPRLERLIVMAKRKGGGHWLDLWRKAAPQRWDLVVDLRGSATSWFLAARERRVKRRLELERDPPVHKVREAAEVLGLDPPPAPVLWLDEAAKAEAAERLPAGAPVLALAPAAATRFKEWPAERFGDLAARLTAPDGPMPDARVALFGGPGDEATSKAAAAGLDAARVIDLTGALGILESAACLARARLFIGNDSGLMHLAAAAGTPTIGLFGPTDERLYGPWGGEIVRAGAPAPERKRHALGAADHSMLGALSVEAVEQAAARRLAAP